MKNAKKELKEQIVEALVGCYRRRGIHSLVSKEYVIRLLGNARGRKQLYTTIVQMKNSPKYPGEEKSIENIRQWFLLLYPEFL